MSKFNQNATGKNIVLNNCGHVAYKMEDRLKLVTMVLTSMFGEPKFYGDNTNELVALAKESDPEFVARLAIYSRKVFHLRSVSHMLCSVVAHNGKQFTKFVTNEVCERPDDITEILSCYLSLYGKPIPNALKKAIASQMGKFNEYSFGKYNGGSKEMKFKDVLRITHPKAITAEQSDIFNKIINDNLATPYTWETELSEKGNNAEVWEKLLDSGKVGYMALLRNMKNIILANPKNIEVMYSRISNKEEVLKSKQFPFRFFSAYSKLFSSGALNNRAFSVLEEAIAYSVDNMEKIKGKTLLAIDTSGSMRSKVSGKSDVSCADIAKLVASMANRLCEDSVIVSFDTKIQQVVVPNTNGIISNATRIPVMGGGTNLQLPIKFAYGYFAKTEMIFDRIIMFSDNEINYNFSRTCQGGVDKYRNDINPNLWIHAIDLCGYGTQQFIGGRTNIIAGWSDAVISFINKAESGLGGLVDEVNKVKLE